MSGEEMSGDMSNGVMSYIRSSGSVLWTACIVVRIQFTDSTCTTCKRLMDSWPYFCRFNTVMNSSKIPQFVHY